MEMWKKIWVGVFSEHSLVCVFDVFRCNVYICDVLISRHRVCVIKRLCHERLSAWLSPCTCIWRNVRRNNDGPGVRDGHVRSRRRIGRRAQVR